MKNVMEINEQQNVTLVSSTDDGSNSLYIHWNCDLSEDPKLQLAGLNIAATSAEFEYEIPQILWSGSGTFTFALKTNSSTVSFTIHRTSDDENVMIQRIGDTEFTLGAAKTSNDISEKTVDIIQSITVQYPELNAGDKVSTLIGKIKKYLSDLKLDGGGKDITISNTSVSYASSSSTSIPTSGWSTTIPTVAGGNYLWTRTVVTYSDGTITTAYTYSKQGKDGTNGTTPTFNRVYRTLDAKSVPSGSATILGSVTLQPGVYVIAYYATFAANATGTRYISFYINTDKARDSTVTGMAVNSGATILNGSKLISISSATTFNLYAWQNSGSANNVSGGWSYIKLS